MLMIAGNKYHLFLESSISKAASSRAFLDLVWQSLQSTFMKVSGSSNPVRGHLASGPWKRTQCWGKARHMASLFCHTSATPSRVYVGAPTELLGEPLLTVLEMRTTREERQAP
jgi:hypothetical protein